MSKPKYTINHSRPNFEGIELSVCQVKENLSTYCSIIIVLKYSLLCVKKHYFYICLL